jgi:hypothetical protein
MSNGMRVWFNVLIEYDKFGNAKIVKSYMVPAKDSDVKKDSKKKPVVKTVVKSGEEDLF